MATYRERLARAETSADLITKAELTVEEVAELFRLSPDLIRHAVWDGTLRARVVGHEIGAIPRDALIDWLRARAED